MWRWAAKILESRQAGSTPGSNRRPASGSTSEGQQGKTQLKATSVRFHQEWHVFPESPLQWQWTLKPSPVPSQTLDDDSGKTYLNSDIFLGTLRGRILFSSDFFFLHIKFIWEKKILNLWQKADLSQNSDVGEAPNSECWDKSHNSSASSQVWELFFTNGPNRLPYRACSFWFTETSGRIAALFVICCVVARI